MTAILLSAALTCIVSLALGQAALRLAGAREWSWLAPPVGLSVAMLVAEPARHVPGGSATVAVLLGALTVAATVWCWRVPAHRPPLGGLLAAAPVLLLALVPFLAVGHVGVLGVGFNNDTAAHMSIVEGYLAGEIAGIAPPDYPVGPHAMVATIAEGLGVRVDRAFVGWSLALPLLSAWTAVALVRRASWLGQVATATVVGMPFLIAAYYGQGAFKEVIQACLVLATALFFSGCGPRLAGRGRWVPLALLLGGVVSNYSVAGLPWPLAFAGLWLLVEAILKVRRDGFGSLVPAVVREIPALAIGLAVLLVSLLPQLPRIWRFVTLDQAAVIEKDDIGNLVGPLSGWEALGVWDNPDFRLAASPPFTGGVWSLFVAALVLFGVYWSWRRGRRGPWMLPFAAGAAVAIWVYSNHSQSPYVAAKALVIASPLLLALAVLPLAEQLPRRLPRSLSSAFRRTAGQPLPWAVAAILAAVLFFQVGLSDVRALRASPVGPTDHAGELRSLRPLLDGQPTLFLGNDDYIRWELAGVPVRAPVVGFEELPIRAGKGWVYGKAHDFDSVGAATLNEFEWIVTTRDAAGSAPPDGVRLVRTTPSYALWRRVGEVEPRSILAEGEMPGAVLDCRSPAGREVLRGGGIAAVRPEPVVAPGSTVAPGGSASVPLDLSPGRWELELAYLSRLPIEVTAPGLRATVPANLDRPGPRWPVGRLTVGEERPTVVGFEVEDPALAPGSALATVSALVATRLAPERVVPIRQACGRYVDWYRGARG